MDRERVGAWLEGTGEPGNRPTPGRGRTVHLGRRLPLPPAAPGPHRPPRHRHVLEAGDADQGDVRVRFGAPVVDADRVAVEWWTTMRAGGSPLTLVGCLVLAFAGDGRCRELRECRKPGRGPGDPPAGWGDLGPDAGNGAAGHARR